MLFLVATAPMANASVDLWLWQTAKAHLPFVLPVEQGQTAEQAARRYVQQIRREPELKELLNPVLNDFVKGKALRKLDSKEEWGLAAANLGDDYVTETKYKRVAMLKAASEKKKFQYYLFPVAGVIHLSVEAQDQALHKIASEATMFTSLGGPDVAADFYEDQNYYCRNCNVLRDANEFRLIKAVAEAKRATVMSFCRGGQIFAIYLGHKMVQDIPSQWTASTSVAHSDQWHHVNLLKTPFGYLHKAFPNESRIFVNSIHHQAILEMTREIKGRFKTYVAAKADDGVIEALEFELGLLLQFHAELAEELWPILWTMIDVARERRAGFN